MVILDQYNRQIPHYKGNQVGKKWLFLEFPFQFFNLDVPNLLFRWFLPLRWNFTKINICFKKIHFRRFCVKIWTRSFHFCSSVLQKHNRNQYGFCLSDQLKIIFICKNLIYRDFGSKFGPKYGENSHFWNFHFSSLVLMWKNCN